MLACAVTALTVLFLPQAAEALPVDVQVAPAAARGVTLDDRLDLLMQRMESERVANHIPGLAIAVVKDDRVVLAKGLGLADVALDRAVSPDTIFAIGSTTKAFTATLIGMLQDDGSLDIDDPVVKHLPYFALQLESADAGEADVVTLRDLLCHRTGFTRMSMLWVSGDAPRRTILETASQAEPWSGFRERFLYNNVMYLAAGMASAAAVDREWDDLIRERIFTPLGMASSTSSLAGLGADARLATGYEWNEDTREFVPKTMADLTNIGPAGSINSNVLDMAEWLRLLLGEGVYEGERLIEEDTLWETWTPNVKISDGASYGLGWMLHHHAGRKVVEHGGNIGGFSAEVALMPDEGLGFVMLSNISMTPLQQTSIQVVFDTLLGDLEEEATGDDDFSEYVGKYRANFASFKDAEFEVLVQNDHLAVDVPEQMVYELHAADAEGKWYFRITDTIAVSFQRDLAGAVVGMTMHQSGMNFEMPRDGVTIAAEIPLEELARYVGTYRDAGQKLDLQVLVQNNRLAVDVPGQMVFELHPPGEDGKRRFRVSDKLAVRFDDDAEGEVATLTFFEPGASRVATRAKDADDTEDGGTALITRRELLELHGIEGAARLLKEHGTYRATGTMRYHQSGVEGTYVYQARLDPPAYRVDTDFGLFGQFSVGCDGETGWSFSALGGFSPMSGVSLRQAMESHPSVLSGDWSEVFDTITISKDEKFDGRPTHVAVLKKDDLPSRTINVDAETGRVVRMRHTLVEGQVRLPVVTTFLDFREVRGVSIAHTVTEEHEMSGRTTTKIAKVEVGVQLADDFHAYQGE